MTGSKRSRGTFAPEESTASAGDPDKKKRRTQTPKSTRSQVLVSKTTEEGRTVTPEPQGRQPPTQLTQTSDPTTLHVPVVPVPGETVEAPEKQPEDQERPQQDPSHRPRGIERTGDKKGTREKEKTRSPRDQEFVSEKIAKKKRRDRTPDRPTTTKNSKKQKTHAETRPRKRQQKKQEKPKKKETRGRKRDPTPKKEKRNKERPVSSSSDSSQSKLTVTLSSSDDDSEREERKEKFAKDLRRTTEGRERFEDFSRGDYKKAVDLFWKAGYYRVESLRQMHDSARTFLVNNLRKMTGGNGMLKDTKLVLDLIEVFQTKMKNSKDPKIEEIHIPTRMKKWCPALGDLGGILIPDQEMVNYFTIELTRGMNEVPPYYPFVTGLLHEHPWAPSDPAFVRANASWKKLQETHKRPNGQTMSFQAFVLSYLRFVLAGDLAGAWTHFGGLCVQMTHLGNLLTISTVENAMTAMAYDRAVRTNIEVQSRRRIDNDQREKLIDMLKTEHDVTKKAVIRELTAGNTNDPVDKGVRKNTLKGDPSRRKGKMTNQKGKRKTKRKKLGPIPVLEQLVKTPKGKRKTPDNLADDRPG